ncbi:Cbb3-type cytochrome c oxidase subunit CcoN1 [compost metagenome]
MWVNGITQGLMWRAVNEDGTLTYSFVEALEASHPGFVVRMIGGIFFVTGMLLMAWNTWRTIRVGDARTTEAVPQAVAHG